MRTLKKTLSLVLALVLCFGLVGTAFAANVDAYTDGEKVGAAYAEAAEVMIGLGIIKGMTDTELGAEGTLTREQAAKIVCYLALGGTVADMLKADKAPFDDVAADRWSAGYISYCADKGILAGYGDGNFGPADELTGYQFAKMLLAALGYGKNNEFTPESWAINTATLGFQNNIFKGDATAAVHTPITRQQAMLMAFNALYAQPKSFVKLTEEYANKGTNFATDVHKLVAVASGVVTQNSANADVETTTVAGTAYKYNTGIELLGHYVKVYYQNVDGSVTGDPAVPTYTALDKVITVLDQSKVVKTGATAVTAQTWASVFGTATYTDDGEDIVRFKSNGTVDTGAVTGVNVTAKTADANVTLIFDNNNEIVAQMADAYSTITADKVTNIVTTAGSEAIVLNGAGSKNNKANDDVVNEYAGIAIGDYVVVTKVGDIYNLQKVQTVEGTITKNANGALTVNGTEYKAFGGTDNSGIVDASPLNFVSTYTLYLVDNTYFAITVKDTSGAVDAGLLYAVKAYHKVVPGAANAYGVVGATTYTYWVQAVNMAGEEVNNQVTWAEYKTFLKAADAVAAGYDVDGTPITTASPYTNEFVEDATKVGVYYTVKTVYDATLKTNVADFTAVASSAAVTTKTSADATSADITPVVTKKITENSNNYYLDGNVTVIYVDGSLNTLKTKVVSGITGAISADMVLYGAKSNITDRNYTVSYIVVKAAAPTATTGTGVIAGFELADSTTTAPYTNALGQTASAYVHTVYIDGVKTEIMTAADTAISGFYSYTIDSVTGLYTIGGAYSYVKAAAKITNNYNGAITNANATDLDVSAAKIVNVLLPTDANYAKVATTGTALTTKETVAVVCTSAWAATVVYVTAYTA